MSWNVDLEKIKQMFAYVNQENISVEEMGVETNEVNQGKKPTLVVTNIGLNGRTPLIEAAICGHHQICEYLITEQNAILEARDDDQKTALILAASSNHIEVIKVLLQNNANIKAKDNNGDHAAYLAACHGALDALKMLVEKDGDVIDLKGEYRETPVIAASRSRRVDVCKYLVEKKNGNVNLKRKYGNSTLQDTLEHNSKIIITLKKNGAK